MEQHTVNLQGTASVGVVGPATGTSFPRATHRHHIFQMILGAGGTPIVKLDFSINGTDWQEFATLSSAGALYRIDTNTPFPYVRARRTDTDALDANKVRVLLRSAGDATNLM